MKAKQKLYYFLQILGWEIYVWLVGYYLMSKLGYSHGLLLFLCGVFLTNISFSHLYRMLIKRLNWINSSFELLSLKVISASFILGVIFSFTTNLFNLLLTSSPFKWIDVNNILVGSFLYFIWNMIYFGYAYFNRSKNQELKNLTLSSEKNEIELQNLRTQLNPHFMFNSMNSIRALIDDEPDKAKQAITKLANILRSALINTENNLIPLSTEITLIKDYLALEKIRYEERLTYTIDLPEDCKNFLIPPMLIQTLIENAIKHGVSKLIIGGEIKLIIKKLPDVISISIVNPGKYVPSQAKKSGSGIGLSNTKKRLITKYGDKAFFNIKNIEENKVETLLTLPL